MTVQHHFREEKYFDSSTHVLQHREAAKSSIASIEEVQKCMNLTKSYLESQLNLPCLILCNWAIDTALKTLYMKDYKRVYPPCSLSLDELLDLTRDSHGNRDLGTVNFIECIRFIVNSPDMMQFQRMEEEHLVKMIRRADTLVSELYGKCYEGYGAVVGYQRVFS
ncbi:hypothetical protein J23TS9_52920 [Paenibacillus sp. J23TS9]|uniref:hypothetical protein n=1 Tax=Paenibacillus sp. J23TS9 TaxID=2807193 RepID=UPI001B1DB273|nr:hypothetical protein [Paenibacillus sp. J23TS9]GIP30162.1 hypothetical protein J23TS9_52920 [Paenibacillus sp. J23TS9]